MNRLPAVISPLALIVLAISLLTYCAPSPSRAYEKGAYRPVQPPAFTPTEDAPHTFRPERKPDVQPGPKPVRVLPETPETRRGPGIWAANPPEASGDDGPLVPERKRGEPIPQLICGPYTCPIAPEADDALDTTATEQCAELIMWGSWKAGLGEYIDALGEPKRTCFLATGLSRCLSWLVERAPNKQYDVDRDRQIAMAQHAAAAAERKRVELCGPNDKLPPMETDWLGQIADAIDAHVARVNAPRKGPVH